MMNYDTALIVKKHKRKKEKKKKLKKFLKEIRHCVVSVVRRNHQIN